MLKYLYSSYLKKNLVGFYMLVAVFSGYFSFSQDEQKKWYFGSAAGLDFLTTPPTPITSSSMFGYREGTASVADPFGNLLFYTDGVTVWNKNDQVMANGTGLFGQINATQSALIVKQPGQASIYFVFTVGYQGLNYSVIDMGLTAGLGAVTAKNIPLNAPTTEKLTGTRHCNGVDVWVVTHDYGTNVFRSLLVTAAGISATPTLSAVGPVFNSRFQSYGQAKISQNGKKLGCAVYHGTQGTTSFELYDFDNSTGAVSNQVVLSIPLNVPPKAPSTNPSPPPVKLPNPSMLFSYGCEFSPDGSKFYGTGVQDTAMYQWDLCAGPGTAIMNSRFRIKSFNSCAMQLAKDGKIYVARINKPALGVIHNPNLAGAACNYVAQGQLLGGTSVCSYGLPNFIAEPPQVPFTYSLDASVSCNAVSFTAPPPPAATVTGCSSTGYNMTGLTWYFGDPASGAANSSTLTNPIHTYPAQGTYTASLVYTYNNSCGGVNTDTLKQEVRVGTPPLVSSGGFNLCTGKDLVLSGPAAQTYSWSNGATSASITVSPSVATTYTVSGIDVSGCPYLSYKTVNVYVSPTVTVKGSTVICPGFQLNLKASGANTYSWSSGSTSSVNLSIQWVTTTYTLYGNSNGCIDAKVITVEVKRPEVLISGGNVTVCPGTPVTLTVSGARDYAWTTGSTNSIIAVTPTVTTVYWARGMDSKTCENSDTAVVTVQTQTPQVDFSYSSPVCESTPSLAPIPSASFMTGGSYASNDLWVDPATGNLDLSATVAGTYFVTYYFKKQGCYEDAFGTATLAIGASPLRISKDISITPGSSTTLQVSGGTNYTWSPAASLSCMDCAEPVATPSANTEYCVISDLNSCISKTCVTVAVTCETNNDYSVPNAFTPNGDGTNDAFCLQGWNACMTSFTIRIFNAWGEQVFQSGNPDFCWDAVYNGRPLDAGVFVYTISARRYDRTVISRKGNITLIR